MLGEYHVLTMDTLADRVRHARDRRMLSQSELAERSGVPIQTISRVERGVVTTPFPKTVRALAEALAVDPHWLRDGVDRGE
jgi:transcriptional regulator with XRE-family HTH domain